MRALSMPEVLGPPPSDTAPISHRPASRAAHEQRRREAAHRAVLLDGYLATVPGEYTGHTTEEVDNGSWGGHLDPSARSSARRLVARGGTRFVLLHGEKGTGKSTLAATLGAKFVADKRVAGRFENAPALLLRFSFDGAETLAEASKVPVLVIDDLGAGNEGVSSHQQRSLWALIEARWSHPELITILTTNMAINTQRVERRRGADDRDEKGASGVGLADYLGPSAWDRIADDLTRIELTGDSFRGSRSDRY